MNAVKCYSVSSLASSQYNKKIFIQWLVPFPNLLLKCWFPSKRLSLQSASLMIDWQDNHPKVFHTGLLHRSVRIIHHVLESWD